MRYEFKCSHGKWRKCNRLFRFALILNKMEPSREIDNALGVPAIVSCIALTMSVELSNRP
ncbi:MAG: hypothetical protein QXJ34_00565 [Candidatus Pacearchaeota archaeon]